MSSCLSRVLPKGTRCSAGTRRSAKSSPVGGLALPTTVNLSGIPFVSREGKLQKSETLSLADRDLPCPPLQQRGEEYHFPTGHLLESSRRDGVGKAVSQRLIPSP